MSYGDVIVRWRVDDDGVGKRLHTTKIAACDLLKVEGYDRGTLIHDLVSEHFDLAILYRIESVDWGDVEPVELD